MYTIEPLEQYIQVAFSGKTSIKERMDAFIEANIVQTTSYTQSVPFVVDFSHCLMPNFPPAKEGDLSRFIWAKAPDCKIAYIVPFLYGPNDFIVQLLSDYGIKAANFLNKDQAFRWLGIQ